MSRFRVIVNAAGAREAFEQVGPNHGKTGWISASPDPELARIAVKAKWARCRENPALYQDKIREYESVLARLDQNLAHMRPGEAAAECMLDHGDVRVDSRDKCAVMDLGGGQWLVFGYRRPAVVASGEPPSE